MRSAVNSGTAALHLRARRGRGIGRLARGSRSGPFTFFANRRGALTHRLDCRLLPISISATFNRDPASLQTASPPGQKQSSRCISSQCAPWMSCQGFGRKRIFFSWKTAPRRSAADYDRPAAAGAGATFGCILVLIRRKTLGAWVVQDMITNSYPPTTPHSSRACATTAAAIDLPARARWAWQHRLDELAGRGASLIAPAGGIHAARRGSRSGSHKLQGAPLALPAPRTGAGSRNAYHHFTLRSVNRGASRSRGAWPAQLFAQLHFSAPLHRQPAYEPSIDGPQAAGRRGGRRKRLSLPSNRC